MPIRNCSFRNFELETKKYKTHNSKLKIGSADNSKLKTQNSKFQNG